FGVALCCGLLSALLLALLLLPPRPEKEFDVPGGGLADFVEHLQGRGVGLRVIWGARDGGMGDYAYLTEDPGVTWAAMQSKPRDVASIDRWRSTAWVGSLRPGVEEADAAQSGPYGCRIGPFLLFGDDRILRQIQEACRKQSGR